MKLNKKKLRARDPECARLSEAELLRREKRRTLELARTRAADDLSRATAAPHRRMLEEALKALDEQLRGV